MLVSQRAVAAAGQRRALLKRNAEEGQTMVLQSDVLLQPAAPRSDWVACMENMEMANE